MFRCLNNVVNTLVVILCSSLCMTTNTLAFQWEIEIKELGPTEDRRQLQSCSDLGLNTVLTQTAFTNALINDANLRSTNFPAFTENNPCDPFPSNCYNPDPGAGTLLSEIRFGTTVQREGTQSAVRANNPDNPLTLSFSTGSVQAVGLDLVNFEGGTGFSVILTDSVGGSTCTETVSSTDGFIGFFITPGLSDQILNVRVDSGDGQWIGVQSVITGNALTQSPSSTPSSVPSAAPSQNPSSVPSAAPSSAPSAAPSRNPSSVPSAAPSSAPSAAPSRNPSSVPSAAPSSSPSTTPSETPTSRPSVSPSAAPSRVPSATPSRQPSSVPSAAPSASPSAVPSGQPSSVPTAVPSGAPSRTFSPSDQPSALPSPSPTNCRTEGQTCRDGACCVGLVCEFSPVPTPPSPTPPSPTPPSPTPPGRDSSSKAPKAPKASRSKAPKSPKSRRLNEMAPPPFERETRVVQTCVPLPPGATIFSSPSSSAITTTNGEDTTQKSATSGGTGLAEYPTASLLMLGASCLMFFFHWY